MEKHGSGWRCRSCGYENFADSASCVYCGEANPDDLATFDELPEYDEDEDEDF
jgi:hypothetical protein